MPFSDVGRKLERCKSPCCAINEWAHNTHTMLNFHLLFVRSFYLEHRVQDFWVGGYFFFHVIFAKPNGQVPVKHHGQSAQPHDESGAHPEAVRHAVQPRHALVFHVHLREHRVSFSVVAAVSAHHFPQHAFLESAVHALHKIIMW